MWRKLGVEVVHVKRCISFLDKLVCKGELADIYRRTLEIGGDMGLRWVWGDHRA